jgi:indoleamine 2,3-dioxygenase
MPGSHRRFLAHVAKIANIREYVTSHPQESGLHAAFNMCLESLVAFRNKHVQMVSRYIVVPSRAPSKAFRNNNGSVVTNGAATGTGGTTPIEFLKQVRDETRESQLRG